MLLKTSFPQPHSYHSPSTDGFYFANLIPSPGSGMQICQEPLRNDTSREDYQTEIQSTLGFATMGKSANLALATRNALTALF